MELTRKVVFLRPLGPPTYLRTPQRAVAMVLNVQRAWKSDRSHVVLGAKELTRKVVFLRPLGLDFASIGYHYDLLYV